MKHTTAHDIKNPYNSQNVGGLLKNTVPAGHKSKEKTLTQQSAVIEYRNNIGREVERDFGGSFAVEYRRDAFRDFAVIKILIEGVASEQTARIIFDRHHAERKQRCGGRCDYPVKIGHQRGIACKGAFVNPGGKEHSRSFGVDGVERIKQIVGGNIFRRKELIDDLRMIFFQLLPDHQIMRLIDLSSVPDEYEILYLRSHSENQFDIIPDVEIGVQEGQVILPCKFGHRDS